MEYNFRETEQKWQKYWADKKTFRAENYSSKPKYYVLDMFPYPSGAGLHVGHPLGYIASDIVARFKRLKGFNVLHPMGYDSFGLPAEQYAIQTGQHPAITTKINIDGALDENGKIKKEFIDENETVKKEALNNENEIIQGYRRQLDKIGFSFDWDREVRTSDPKFYKWTQWIFIQLFNSWYNKKNNKAEKIEILISEFEKNGNKEMNAAVEDNWHKKVIPEIYGFRSDWNGVFSSEEWNALNEKPKQEILMHFRLAYLSIAYVNWCAALGTVLANEEVKDGLSERGGYPVERKLMDQWSLRITAYAERLLSDLDIIDWTESLKESQRNWIGESKGCSVKFKLSPEVLANVKGLNEDFIEVFTTRPDTIFGVSFLALAPENLLGTALPFDYESRLKVSEYLNYALNRSERDRMAEVKKITGVFTGAFAIHPFSGKQIPIWVADYVLAGYGTGAVMGVPAHDSRDFAFANHFGLDIIKVIEPNDKELSKEECFDTYDGYAINSDFINNMQVKDAIKKIISEIEKRGLGKGKTNYRLRDANFGRQRYWGEPIPIYYNDGIPHTIPESELPLVLPEVDKYLPTENGEPPLARAKNWKYKGEYDYEHTTMPGWAGSSWYYLRYMDAHNEKEFASREAINYWKDVDLYIGGDEHATGHLLYVRFWTKFLNDLGYISVNEPAKKLINQGKILGVSEKIFNPKSVIESSQGRNENNTIIYWHFETLDSNVNEIINQHFNKYGLLNVPIGAVYESHDRFKVIVYVSADLILEENNFISIHVNINLCDSSKLNIEKFMGGIGEKTENLKRVFVTKNGLFIDSEFYPLNSDKGFFYTKPEVEKMSKSKYNIVNPDEIVHDFGADCLRLYEMFLGPLEQSKPWNTNGISGVSNFIRKLWRLFHDNGVFKVSDEPATKAELKTLHKTIKKVTDDIERYSFNTSVSNFMICVNELTDLKCNKREILEPLTILISPYAPHIAEELWEKLGNKESITFAQFPVCKEEYLVEDSFEYPISINGKTRFKIPLSLQLTKEQIEKEVLSADELKKYLDGNAPKKIIVVPGRIVNVVI